MSAIKRFIEEQATVLSNDTGCKWDDAMDALTLTDYDMAKAKFIIDTAKKKKVEPFVVMAELIIEAAEKGGTIIHF